MTTVAFAVLSGGAPASSQACDKRHQTPFELFELADTVAYITVRATPAVTEVGPVEFDLIGLVKGKSAPLQVFQESNSDCRAGFVIGAEGLVFLDPGGHVLGAYEGYLRTVTAWKPVITRWAAAQDASERAEILVDAIVGSDRQVSEEAMDFLIDAPALVDAVTVAHRSRIAAAAKTRSHWRWTPLLARLRDPSAPARAINKVWRTAAKRFLAVTEFASVTEPETLATAIETRKGAAKRMAAMERCERVRQVKLVPFLRYFWNEPSWATLAQACRTGVAVP